jgi:hypothetical protein
MNTRIGARLWVATMAVCVTGTMAGGVNAATYEFVTGQSNYQLPVGSSTQIEVFLRETLAGGESTSFLADEGGLFSAVTKAQHFGSVPSSPALLTASARNTTNFGDQDDSAVTAGGAQATLGGTRSLGASNGTGFILDSATVRRVSVGTLTVKAGDVPLELTTFQLGDRTGSFEDTITWAHSTLLDPQISATTFNVTAVPEPAGAACVGAALLSAAAVRSRRRAD